MAGVTSLPDSMLGNGAGSACSGDKPLCHGMWTRNPRSEPYDNNFCKTWVHVRQLARVHTCMLAVHSYDKLCVTTSAGQVHRMC